MVFQRGSFATYLLLASCVATYLFLYTPIILLIIFSFNESTSPYLWKGWSLKWYYELFYSLDVINALKNSLIVAISSMTLSIIFGTLCVFYSARTSLAKSLVLFYGSLAAPEIVLAVSLLSTFSFFTIPLGLTTLIISHTLISLGYIIPIVKARFAELDYRFTEASLDLGATETQTFTKIIIPLLSPSLIAGGLLVFVISLDDFVISFFCAGGTTQTLPIFIYSMIRSGSTPIVSAISVVLLAMSSIIVLIFSLLQVKKIGVLQ